MPLLVLAKSFDPRVQQNAAWVLLNLTQSGGGEPRMLLRNPSGHSGLHTSFIKMLIDSVCPECPALKHTHDTEHTHTHMHTVHKSVYKAALPRVSLDSCQSPPHGCVSPSALPGGAVPGGGGAGAGGAAAVLRLQGAVLRLLRPAQPGG